MKTRVVKEDACRRVLKIEIDKDAVEKEFAAVAGEYAAAVKIPGFRKGKAPVSLVERRFAKEVMQETQDRLLPRSCREALDAEGIEPVAMVGIKDVNVAEDRTILFDFVVDVAPQFKVPRHKGLALIGNDDSVADEQVDTAFNQLLDRSSSYEDTTDRAVECGDMVQIDYVGECEGTPVADMSADAAAIGAATDFWMLVDEGGVLPGLGEGIEGMRPGDSRKISVRFPVDFRVKELGSRTASYAVTVKAVREKKLPEMNEDFLKPFEVASEEELRGKIRESLEESAREEERRRRRSEAARVLLEKTKIEVPQSLVEQETRRIVNDVVSRSSAGGMSQEDIVGKQDDIVSAASKSSEERVKLGFILERIAEAEGISVDSTEVDERIDQMSRRYGVEAARLRQELERRETLSGLENDIRSEKALDFVLEKAKIKVKK